MPGTGRGERMGVTMRRIRTRLTYANVMSTLCLFIAMGGVSYAAVSLPRNSVGAVQLRPNAVTSAKIAPNTVRGVDVRESTLAKVPSASKADQAAKADTATKADLATKASTADLATKASTADLATKATLADTATEAVHAGTASALTGLVNIPLKRLVAVDGANFAAAQTAAPETVLYTKGQLSITAKCFTNLLGPQTYARVYIKTSADGAVLSSDQNNLEGGASISYLNSTTIEDNRYIAQSAASVAAGRFVDGDPEYGLFAALGVDSTALQGQVITGAKNGAPAGGNGPWGAGNSCVFYGSVFSS